MYTITEEQMEGIPTLHIYRDEYKGKELPTFLFWHGFSSGKEHNLHIAYHLARKGIRVVLPDAMCHGERSEGLTEKQRLFEFWNIVVRCVKETKFLRDHLENRELVKDRRFFLGGTSMGGILTCGALTVYPWIKGGVILMGNPSWERFAKRQITILGHQGALPLSEEEAEEQVQQLIPYDLSQHESKVNGRPLFFWHGRDDDVVPYQDSYQFYKKLKEQRNDNRSLIYHLDPAAGHKVSREGMLKMTDWVEEFI